MSISKLYVPIALLLSCFFTLPACSQKSDKQVVRTLERDQRVVLEGDPDVTVYDQRPERVVFSQRSAGKYWLFALALLIMLVFLGSFMSSRRPSALLLCMIFSVLGLYLWTYENEVVFDLQQGTVDAREKGIWGLVAWGDVVPFDSMVQVYSVMSRSDYGDHELLMRLRDVEEVYVLASFWNDQYYNTEPDELRDWLLAILKEHGWKPPGPEAVPERIEPIPLSEEARAFEEENRARNVGQE